LMDVVRIIQESMHNAVERSGCTSLSVLALKDADQRDIIVITNRGGTTYRQQSERGHGISSMQQRAKRIGAEFYIESRPSGGRVRLIMPKSPAV
jgi:signal transduction histidine kinase